MKIHQVEQRSDEWHQLRKGKITGTNLKRILSNSSRDAYFYEIIAERLSISGYGVDEESARDRGTRLEPEAIALFEQITGKIVEEVGFCEHDDNEFMCSSPDGLIKDGKKFTEAVEVKCLSGGKHVKAWLENKIPKSSTEDYMPQCIQYFIVNKDLKKLHFVLYNPRIGIMPIWIITINRADIEEQIAYYQEQQEEFINEVNERLEEIISL